MEKLQVSLVTGVHKAKSTWLGSDHVAKSALFPQALELYLRCCNIWSARHLADRNGNM